MVKLTIVGRASDGLPLAQGPSCAVENGVCFIALCDSSYPRKLAFHYLQDLQQEFDKFDMAHIQKITTRYSFIKFDGIICRISKQYVDTRTQANLSKLNAANRPQDLNIVTEHMSQLLERRRRLGELILHMSPDELIAFYILF
ncbi:hypothetical protein LguiB_003649 [Lonicera macranthoides]